VTRGMQNFGQLSFHANLGIHRCTPIRYWVIPRGHKDHSGRRASATADASNFHGGFVDAGAVVLGP